MNSNKLDYMPYHILYSDIKRYIHKGKVWPNIKNALFAIYVFGLDIA